MLEHIVIGFLLLNGMEISDAAEGDPRDYFDCGILIDSTSITLNKTKWIGQFPWNVECILDNSAHFGGTLIHPSVVLTSGEMIRRSDPDDITVHAGGWITENMTFTEIALDRGVVEIILNEFYTFAGLQMIGLLILKTPYRLYENINTICLPQPTASYDKSNCFLSQSKPATSYYSGNYEPEQFQFGVTNHKACTNYLIKSQNSSVWDRNFICADQFFSNNLSENCRFSKGYALACPLHENPTRYVQAGVSLFNVNCSIPGNKGIFGNIADVRSWIDQIMDDLEFDKSAYILPSQLACEKNEEQET